MSVVKACFLLQYVSFAETQKHHHKLCKKIRQLSRNIWGPKTRKKISPSKRVFSQAFSIEEHPPSFFDLQEIEHQDCPVASTRYVLWTPPSSFLGIAVLICKPRLSSLQASDCDRHKPQMDTRLQIIKYITSTSQMCGSSGRPDVLACQ